MHISVYPLRSSLHKNQGIAATSAELLDALAAKTGSSFAYVADVAELYRSDLTLILIQSGGTEGDFLKVYPELKEPFYLLTTGTDNSLAASLEILTYLQSHGRKAEVLHGTVDYLAGRLAALSSPRSKRESRLGVVGKPSDWLISSDVDRNQARRLFGVELVDIGIEKIKNLSTELDPAASPYEFKDFDRKEIAKALQVYAALDKVVSEEKLSGLTIRCFSLLDTIHTTACLALALLNARGIIGTCEGDIPAMITMELVRRELGLSSFQCNPSLIDVENGRLVLAHCTLPLDMCSSFRLDTHFESGIGVAVKGELPLGPVTVFKLAPSLDRYLLLEGEIVKNLGRANLCRTQIEIATSDDLNSLLRHPCGNHLIVVIGHHKKALTAALERYLA